MRSRLAVFAAPICLLLFASTCGGAPGVQGGITRDLVYEQVGTQSLQLDVYAPGGNMARPTVVLVHGGGWRRGSHDQMRGVALDLMQQGFVAVSIDYRLDVFPSGHPAEVQDVQAAYAFVVDHAATFGIDSNRIALWGTSSGGNLAALAAERLSAQTSLPHARAVVSWSGPMDLPSLWATDRAITARSNIEDYLGCAPASCLARAKDASPVFAVTSAAPPMFFAHGELDDVPSSQADEMITALTAVGVRTRLVIVPGEQHGLSLAPFVTDDSITFLTSILGRPPAPVVTTV